MIATIAFGGIALALAALVIAAATRKRRRMARHPAPTFVFAAGRLHRADRGARRRGRGADGARVQAHDVRAES